MNSNGLKFNVEKTQLMTMNPGHNRSNDDMCIKFNNHLITQERNAKFLGLTISNNLRWNDYVFNSEDSMLNFCYKKLRALKLMARNCDKHQRLILANGMIISKLTYCCTAWGNASLYLKEKVQKLLNETYRVVAQDWKSDVWKLHRDLNVLSIDGWIRYMTIMEGKRILDFQKPVDMKNKISDQIVDDMRTAPVGPTQVEDRNILTRALMRGNIRYTAANSTNYHPRFTSFIPRFVRDFKRLDAVTKSWNLQEGDYKMRESFRYNTRLHCIIHQQY